VHYERRREKLVVRRGPTRFCFQQLPKQSATAVETVFELLRAERPEAILLQQAPFSGEHPSRVYQRPEEFDRDLYNRL
jgi:hypothetical protein